MINFAFLPQLSILMIVSFIIYSIVMLVASKKHTVHLAVIMVFALVLAPVLNLVNVLPAFAYDEEACMEYDEGIVCVGLDVSSRDYEFDVRVGDYQGNNSPVLRCEIRHSSSSTALWESCQDTIRWTGSDGQFLVSATLDGEDGTFTYDIDDESWDLEFDEVDPDDVDGFYNGGSNNNDDDDDNNSNSDDVEDIVVSSPTSQHVEDGYIDVTVTLLDGDDDIAVDATSKVNFKVQKRSSNGWFDAAGSTYSLVRTSYTFTSSDNGKKVFDNLVVLHSEGEYRLVVELDEDDDILATEEFDIGVSSGNDDDAVGFEIDLDNNNPNEDEYVDVILEVEDANGSRATDYRNTVKFNVYYLDDNTWRKTVSSTYVTFKEQEYRFTSSDSGRVTLSNWLRFNKEETYKIEVYDEDDTSVDGNMTVEVEGTSSGGDDGEPYAIEMDIEDSTPVIDQWLDLDVSVVDDNGDVVQDFSDDLTVKVYYKNGSTRQQTTSSTYFSIDMNTIEFNSSDDGEKTLTNFIRFKRNEEFKIELEWVDDSSVDGQVGINVGGSSNNYDEDLDSIKVTTADTTPNVNQWVSVTFEMMDSDGRRVESFDDEINFVVYWNDDGDWRETTSPSHFEINASHKNGYEFDSSDDGKVTLSNFIRFKQNARFRLKAEVDGQSAIDGYVTYTVGTATDDDEDVFTTSSPDLLSILPLTKDINVNDKVDFNIKAVTDNGAISQNYRDKVVFVTRELSSSSSRTWQTPSNGDYRTTLTSYTFTSTDKGQKNLYDIWEPRANGYYRIAVQQDDDNDILGRSYVFVTDNVSYANTMAGFSSSERTKMRAYYKAWPEVINAILDRYPELVGDTDWEELWLDFYAKMEKTVKATSGKFTSYSNFYSGLKDFVEETVNDYVD